MRPKYGWALSTALSTLLVAPSAVAVPNAVLALCPVEDPTVRPAPTCVAVHVLSKRGYLVLPGTRIFVGIATERVNLMIRIAVF